MLVAPARRARSAGRCHTTPRVRAGSGTAAGADRRMSGSWRWQPLAREVVLGVHHEPGLDDLDQLLARDLGRCGRRIEPEHDAVERELGLAWRGRRARGERGEVEVAGRGLGELLVPEVAMAAR